MKLMLVSADGEVLDVSNSFTAHEWNQARQLHAPALALLQTLRRVEES